MGSKKKAKRSRSAKSVRATAPKYRGDIGRPSLWYSSDFDQWGPRYDRMRIVYPDGRVEYCPEGYIGKQSKWQRGCTSSNSYSQALLCIQMYDLELDETPIFLGYL